MEVKRVFLFLIIFVFTIINTALAGPTVIRDNRIRDLAVTPVLGRGYTISTNTFQSTCLKNIRKTKPSYDLTYNYKELKSNETSRNIITNTLTKIAPKAFLDFIDKKVQEIEQKKGTTATTTTKKTFKHRIIVTINLHSYYSSVDEANSSISDSAVNLLQNKDIPGFFNSCGSYYVRSIGRRATLFSLFESEHETEEEAKQFTYALETQLKSFKKIKQTTVENKYSGYWFWRRKTSEKRTTREYLEEDKAASKTESKGTHTDTFENMASKTNLRITTMAFGLGKDKKANIISYDVPTFKKAVKDAFISMMDDDTGKVVNIEVVPWIENTEFQNLIELEKETKKISTTPSGDNAAPAKEETLLLYEKKEILNQNAEFLAEVERANRNLTNLYYKAKICRGHINHNWKETKKGTKEKIFRTTYQNRYVRNNRFPSTGIPLTVLDNYLSKETIKKMLNEQKQFMYGGGIYGNGARECIKQIMKIGIFRIPYTDLNVCTELAEQFGQHEYEIVENHCMPVLFSESHSNYLQKKEGKSK